MIATRDGDFSVGGTPTLSVAITKTTLVVK
jgi:hypothetical protein